MPRYKQRRARNQPNAHRRNAAKNSRISHYFGCHFRACLSGLGRLTKTPIASLLTLAVISIALALPSALLVILDNAKNLSQSWQNDTKISLFLKHDVTAAQAQDFILKLKVQPQIASVNYISPSQGLEQFQKQTGIGDVLAQLPQNPIPAVIQILPANTLSPMAINSLLTTLKANPMVTIGQLDMQWVKRLYSIMSLIRHGIEILGSILAVAILLIIGNTIRLTIQNYHQEIKVIKLIGGTNAYVRRPFLYLGMLYGFFGSIAAWILINMVLWWLNTPIEHLASLYNSPFYLQGLGASDLFTLLISGALLGLVGSWLAVNQQISQLEAY